MTRRDRIGPGQWAAACSDPPTIPGERWRLPENPKYFDRTFGGQQVTQVRAGTILQDYHHPGLMPAGPARDPNPQPRGGWATPAQVPRTVLPVTILISVLSFIFRRIARAPGEAARPADELAADGIASGYQGLALSGDEGSRARPDPTRAIRPTDVRKTTHECFPRLDAPSIAP
jgi:hypothetical protein